MELIKNIELFSFLCDASTNLYICIILYFMNIFLSGHKNTLEKPYVSPG